MPLPHATQPPTAARPSPPRAKPRTLDAAVEPFDLPPELAALARAIARRTRLFPSEQIRVAADAAAAIQTRLSQGASPPEIPALLGDLDQLAASYRQAALRKRSLLAVAIGGWRRHAARIILIPLLLYALLFIRFQIGSPTIARNYAAELTSPYAHLSDAERAEPHYLEANHALPRKPDNGFDPWLSLRPGTPAWSEVAEYLGKSQSSLAIIREAAAMDVLGAPLINHVGASPWVDVHASYTRPIPDENPVLIHTPLWHLAPLREHAYLLILDAHHAAAEGDAATVAADLIAALGIARHLRELPILIGDLVSVRIIRACSEHLRHLLEEHPGLFSDDDLARLDAAFSRFDDRALSLRLEGERASFYDLIQRIYTDNGRGSGRLTPPGMRLLKGILLLQDDPQLTIADHLRSPFIMMTAPSRREITEIWEHIIALTEADARLDPWQSRTGRATLEINDLAARQNHHYDIVTRLIPALDNAIREFDQTRLARDAAIVGIALERYRLRHGHHAEDLARLTPELLSAIPLDPFDGAPLKCILRNGVAHIYSCGPNRRDDGGAFVPYDRAVPDQASDQLLWPIRSPAETNP